MGSISQRNTTRSTATEAIFSKSGQVKTRIPNYETTVVDTSDKILVFPPQDNSNEIDIPGVLDTVSEISDTAGNTIKKPIRFSTVLVSFIIALTFSWSVYSLFFTVKSKSLALDNVVSSEETASSDTSSLSELKSAANKLLDSSIWKTSEINHFLTNWNHLSETQVRQATKTPWYQMLEFNVKKQISQQQKMSESNHVATISDQSLLTLGLVMGILEQTDNAPASTKDNSRYDQLLAELTNELKQADKVSKNGIKSQESESDLNAKLREKFAAQKQELQKSIRSTPTPEKLAKLEKTTENLNAHVSVSITRNDIDSVISNYKRAYEKGDLKLMAGLFGAASVDSKKFEKVKSNFNTTFTNTINRSMNFYDVHTNSSGESATIDGKFNASVEFKNGKGIQYTVANIKLYVSKLNDQVVINQVKVLDRKVNVVETDNNLITSSNGMLTALDNKASFPTAAELQDVTTQLVTAYETGNLNQFISLFSSEIKTNDRIDLSGLQQDYAQLFASTSDRQMFIQNLKWTNENIGAKGIGDLEVIILSDEGNTVYSMEGKIQIVAQKIDRKVKITHLYHIERAK